jgi:acetolactate synthase-1/2/3 large subunit
VNGAEAIARLLKTEGIEYLFVFPRNPLIDPAAKVGIRPIMARTERTVVAMADGYSRAANGKKIGVVAVQDGPGVENTFGGVAQAWSDSTPILVFPALDSLHRLYQQPITSSVTLYREITKWAACVTGQQRIPEMIRRAFTHLRMGHPGPVLLELPWPVAEGEADESLIATYQPVKATRSQADPADVAAAVRALLAAKTPVIHAGQGVMYADACAELREFAELTQVPVMTTLPGKSAFPETHALALGSGGRACPAPVYTFLQQADLIFGIGCSFNNIPFSTKPPRDRVMVQVNVDESDINTEWVIQHPLIGDAKLVLQQCLEEVKRQTSKNGRPANTALQAEIKAQKDAWRAKWMPKLGSSDVPINPYRVIWAMMHAFDPKDVIITHDSGTPRDMLSPCWPAVEPRGYIGWGKSTHLGYSLGLALGAKLAAPEKTVINFMGDGAFGMTGMDIETAARNRIGTLTVLLNNSTLGNYGHEMPFANDRYQLRYFKGDYAAVARSLGVQSQRVEQPDGLAPALAQAKEVTAGGEPFLLEVMTREETELSLRG